MTMEDLAGRLDTRIDNLAVRLDARIDNLAGRLDTRMEDLTIRVDARMDDLAVKMDGLATKEMLGDAVMKIDSEIDEKVHTAVGRLAIMVEEGFAATAKQEDLLALTERVTVLEKEMKGMHGNFDMVFQQLKEIRIEIKEGDARADVVDLQLRVAKLERKVKS